MAVLEHIAKEGEVEVERSFGLSKAREEGVLLQGKERIGKN